MAATRSLNVLVVDDNTFNQEIAKHMLESLGASVDVAVNGQVAVEMFEQSSYDLVLMDCQMPVMDGYTATARIRQIEGVRSRTPIIAVTAHAMQENREKCLDAGMDDYLTKPVRFGVLTRAVERWTRAEE